MILSQEKRGILALVLLSFVFSCMGIFARYLETDFSLFQQVYVRILGASLLGTVLFFGTLRFARLPTLSKKDWSVVIFRAVMFCAGATLFTLAFLTTKYSNATVVAFIPILPILGYFFLNERVGWKKLSFVALGFVGVALVAVSDLSSPLSWGHGELFALLSGIAFDFGYIARKWQSDHLSNLESALLIFFVEGLLLFALSFFLHEPPPGPGAFGLLTITMVILGSLFNVLQLFLVNYGFERVKATIAGNILTLEILFGLLFSIFLYGEVPGVREFLGGALILVSVYFVNKFKN